MDLRKTFLGWPLVNQLTTSDRLGRGAAATSTRTRELRAPTETADRVVGSVFPYCAVGCAQRVFVKDGRVTQIEGDPDTPVSRGRLCPKGSASFQLTTGSARRHEALYRPPYAAHWQRIDLDSAMNMVADRIVATRAQTWQDRVEDQMVNRTLGIVATCWYGGAVALARAMWSTLHQREPDQIALMILAQVDRHVEVGGRALIEAAARVDDGSADGAAGAVLAEQVRGAVASAAEAVLTASAHARGPAPLVEDEKHARRVADLEIYLRHHHAERDDARLGRLLLTGDATPW